MAGQRHHRSRQRLQRPNFSSFLPSPLNHNRRQLQRQCNLQRPCSLQRRHRPNYPPRRLISTQSRPATRCSPLLDVSTSTSTICVRSMILATPTTILVGQTLRLAAEAPSNVCPGTWRDGRHGFRNRRRGCDAGRRRNASERAGAHVRGADRTQWQPDRQPESHLPDSHRRHAELDRIAHGGGCRIAAAAQWLQ